MDPRLGVFLTVARVGQLTQASRDLNLAPSSVSQQIAGLEHDLGTTLFTRSSRGMQLTTTGRLLFAAAEEMDGLWQETRRNVGREESHSSQVRIAASHTVTELFLPRPLGRFRAQWPETRIHLTMTNSASVIEQVNRGMVDIGLVEGAPSSGTSIRHGSRIALWQDTLGLVVSKAHPLSRHAVVTIEDVLEQSWILREAGSGTRRVFEEALEHAGIAPFQLNILMELSSLRAILAMVANHVGVSVVSEAIVKSTEIALPTLTLVPIAALKLSRTIECILPLHPSISATQLLHELERDVSIRHSQDSKEL